MKAEEASFIIQELGDRYNWTVGVNSQHLDLAYEKL